MAHIFTIFAGILATVITAVFIRKRIVRKASISVVLIALLTAAAGVGMIYNFESQIELALARRYWPTTEGTVIKREIAGIRAYHPEITCQYVVNGQAYSLTTSLGTPGFGNRRSRLRFWLCRPFGCRSWC